MHLGIDQTPLDRFFVCDAGPAPAFSRDTWRLVVDGDAATRTVTLKYDDLAALPQHRVSSWLECAGNGRSMFARVAGHRQAAVSSSRGRSPGGKSSRAAPVRFA